MGPRCVWVVWVAAAVVGAADDRLLLHLHVPKTGGGELLTKVLPRLSDAGAVGALCYRRLNGAPPLQIQCCFNSRTAKRSWAAFAASYRPGACGVASGEWTYAEVAALGLASRARVVTFVREPMSVARSIIDHDIKLTTQGIGAKRFHFYESPREKLELIAAGADRGIPLEDMQSRWLLPDGLNEGDIAGFLRDAYFFVGVSDWYFHSECVFGHAIGAFDAARCRCANLAAERATPHKNQMRATNVYTSADIGELAKLVARDGLLYAAAVSRFVEAVTAVDAATGSDLATCLYDPTYAGRNASASLADYLCDGDTGDPLLDCEPGQHHHPVNPHGDRRHHHGALGPRARARVPAAHNHTHTHTPAAIQV
jgi:hypothetical protein